jgi:hypothetical protein
MDLRIIGSIDHAPLAEFGNPGMEQGLQLLPLTGVAKYYIGDFCLVHPAVHRHHVIPPPVADLPHDGRVPIRLLNLFVGTDDQATQLAEHPRDGALSAADASSYPDYGLALKHNRGSVIFADRPHIASRYSPIITEFPAGS